MYAGIAINLFTPRLLHKYEPNLSVTAEFIDQNFDGVLSADEDGIMFCRIENLSEYPIDKIVMRFDTPDDIIFKQLQKLQIKKLDPGEKKEFRMLISGADKLKTGKATISITGRDKYGFSIECDAVKIKTKGVTD
ncbi:MAG: hypothetical protein AB1349_13405 [Elusimicrobiota bacterium]